MSEKREINQRISNNTGQAQAIKSGRDTNATQQISQSSSGEKLTTEQAIQLLTKIEELIKEANLPEEETKQAIKYTQKAKEEAEEEEPDGSIISSHLKRMTNTVKKLNQMAEGTEELINHLTPALRQLSGWLGMDIDQLNIL